MNLRQRLGHLPQSTPNFKETLAHLPPQVLFELARNEAAQLIARVAAAELLLEGGHKQSKSPEIESLIAAVIANWKQEEVNFTDAPAPEGETEKA
ncbi:MAG: hypothetical protein JWQ87_2004 [Candidatus Sulfotelmatobacter sp.]|nr:hypothetical protein [Candidatus Sulfotelmatobacter sp.]